MAHSRSKPFLFSNYPRDHVKAECSFFKIKFLCEGLFRLFFFSRFVTKPPFKGYQGVFPNNCGTIIGGFAPTSA